MAKLILMRGLPGSGKSTRAKEIMVAAGNIMRVNRDLLRTMLHFDQWTGPHEQITIDMEMALVRTLLGNDHNVIIDDTNLGQRHRDRWSGIAKECDARFEVVDLTDVPLETCIERDRRRDASVAVGDHVIKGMAMQYRLVTFEDKSIVICDLDGTLSDPTHRVHYVQQELKDWKSFLGACGNDPLRVDVAGMVQAYHEQGLTIVLVSGRSEEYRVQTLCWLYQYQIPYFTLLMRRAGDHRPDVEVKRQILHTYFDPSWIKLAIDDRASVIREVWRAEGIECLDVGAGVEF